MADYITGRDSGSGMGLWITGGIVVLLVVIFALFAMGDGGTVPGDPTNAPAAGDPVQTTPAATDPATPAPVAQ